MNEANDRSPTPARLQALAFIEKYQLRALQVPVHLTPWDGVRDHQDLKARLQGVPWKLSYGRAPDPSIDEFDRALDARRTAMPTRFEDPACYAILSRLSHGIEQVVHDGQLALPTKPILATAPINDVNAKVAWFPKGAIPPDEYAIVFDRSLVPLFHQMAGLFVSCLPTTGTTFVMDYRRASELLPKLDAGVEMHFLNIFTVFVRETLLRVDASGEAELMISGKMAGLQPIVLDEMRTYLRQLIVDAMESFIVAHEYAHILSSHFDPSEGPWSDDWPYAHRYQIHLHAQEHEADVLGSRISSRFMSNQCGHLSGHDALLIAGGDMALTCLDLIGRVTGIVKTGTQPKRVLPNPYTGDGYDQLSRSHPPCFLRRQFLRSKTEQAYGEVGMTRAGIEAALSLGRLFEYFAEMLMSRVEGGFRFYYEMYRRITVLSFLGGRQ
jgi:hypothetical protein